MQLTVTFSIDVNYIFLKIYHSIHTVTEIGLYIKIDSNKSLSYFSRVIFAQLNLTKPVTKPFGWLAPTLVFRPWVLVQSYFGTYTYSLPGRLAVADTVCSRIRCVRSSPRTWPDGSWGCTAGWPLRFRKRLCSWTRLRTNKIVPMIMRNYFITPWSDNL